MTKLTAEQMAKGRERFLTAHPEVKRKIDALNQADADFMCTSLETLRASETMKALSEVAHSERKDSNELFLSCIADTAEEFRQLLEARNRAIQGLLGA